MSALDAGAMLAPMNATATPGYYFWRLRLEPLARAGFTRGVLDAHALELERPADGERLVLKRPRGGWIPASWVLLAAERDEALEYARISELGDVGRALARVLTGNDDGALA
jgi:hypothetical protein